MQIVQSRLSENLLSFGIYLNCIEVFLFFIFIFFDIVALLNLLLVQYIVYGTTILDRLGQSHILKQLSDILV